MGARILLVLAALPILGCASAELEDVQPTGLEAGFALREQPRRGDARGLTHGDGRLDAVARSADGRKVDLDSSLLIVPLPTAIRAALPDTGSVAGIDGLTQDTAELADLVGLLADYVVLRDVAMRAYDDAKRRPTPENLEAFGDKRSKAAELERELIPRLRGLAPRVVEADEVQAKAADFAQLGELLSDKLAELEERQARLTDAATFELRMEAFLRSPDKEPAAVHLPGYDSLAEGQLVRRDRRGLLLEGDERLRFEQLTRESQRLAELGNRYLDGQAELAQVFEGLAGTVLEDLAPVAIELDRLVKDFEGGEPGRRLQALEVKARALLAAIEAAGAQASTELTAEATQLLEGIENSSAAKLRVLAERVKSLGQLLKDPSPASIAAAVDLIHAMVTDQESWNLGIGEIGAQLEGLGQFVEELGAELNADVAAAYSTSGIDDDIEYFKDLSATVKAALKPLGELSKLSDDIQPLRFDLRVPEAIDVDLDAAPPTTLRLRRTQRMDGDTLSLRMTVLDGGKPVGDPLLLDLDIATIGWHARLDPSVVLAKPEDGLAGSAEYRFAPAVSWLWSYTPADDAGGFWNGFARGTGFGIGPHATFLSFDQDKEIEIGLGLTLSFWDGVLQFGAGYDLMADSSTSYTFIGSSLIGVLQRLGER